MVTAEGIAWFFMSEGCLNIEIRRDKKAGIGYRMYPTFKIDNTDHEMISDTESWFLKNSIICNKSSRVGTNKPVYRIRTSCYSVKKVLDKIYPFLLGSKKKIADLVYEYFIHVWKPPDCPTKYKAANRRRFLEGVKIHDQICDIVGLKTRNRKYDVQYFLKEFGYAPNPELFRKP